MMPWIIGGIIIALLFVFWLNYWQTIIAIVGDIIGFIGGRG